MTLTLRKTIIGGKTAAGDYVVLEDGRAIGRIRFGHGPDNEPRWNWNVTVNDPARTVNGWKSTFEEAKAAFKASWERSAPQGQQRPPTA